MIHLENGKRFTIAAHNNSADRIYVKSVDLDGHAQTGWSFSHRDILRGATLTFEMGLLDRTMQEQR